jgi:hypothetical protein
VTYGAEIVTCFAVISEGNYENVNVLPGLLSNGYRCLFTWGVKRPGREDDYAPLSSAEVK